MPGPDRASPSAIRSVTKGVRMPLFAFRFRIFCKITISQESKGPVWMILPFRDWEMK